MKWKEILTVFSFLVLFLFLESSLHGQSTDSLSREATVNELRLLRQSLVQALNENEQLVENLSKHEKTLKRLEESTESSRKTIESQNESIVSSEKKIAELQTIIEDSKKKIERLGIYILNLLNRIEVLQRLQAEQEASLERALRASTALSKGYQWDLIKAVVISGLIAFLAGLFTGGKLF